MRRLLILSSLLLLAPSAYSQNTRYDNIALSSRGVPLANQNVAVCTQPANVSTTPCSTLATIFSTAAGAAQINPLQTDLNGNYHFYAVPGSTFTIQIYGPQIQTPFVMTDISIPLGGGTNNAFTGNNTHSGTETFTGLIQCKNMEHEACVDTGNSQSWTGADFCAWIVSAQASLASTGGIVHAYLNGATVTCAGTFNVGTAAQGVKLFLDAGEIDVQNLINVAQGSRLQGLNGGSGNAGTTPTVIKAGASFPTSGVYLIQMGPSIGTADGTSLQDIQLNLNNVALSKAINVSSVQDIGDITNVFILNNVGNAVDITGSAQNITFTNVVNIASAIATADNCYTIPATADHVVFINTGCTSTAAGGSTGAAFQCNGCNIGIYSSHVEKHTDGVLLNGSGANQGAVVINQLDGLLNMTNMVHIASGWNGSLSATGIRKFLATNSIKNDLAAFNHTCTDESLAIYAMASNAGTTQQLMTTCSSLASTFKPGFYIGDLNGSAAASDLVKLNFDPVTYDGIVMGNHGSATRKWAFGPGTGGAGWGLRQQTPNTQTAFVCLDASPFNCAFQVPITPNAAGAVDIGSTSLPWGNLWLGTAATNNFKVQPPAAAAARIISWVDPGATSGLFLGGSNLTVSPIAPTIAGAGCGGSAASIVSPNGTAAFKINVGTAPTTACTVTMPAATTGWNCYATDITTNSTTVFLQKQTGAESTTSVIITNFSDVAAASNFTANDILKVSCHAD